MDYGKIAYSKCVDFERTLSHFGGRAEFFRLTRNKEGMTEFGSDPVTVKGRGIAHFKFTANGGSFSSVVIDSTTVACPDSDRFFLSVPATPEGVTLQVFAKGATEIETYGCGISVGSNDEVGRGVVFSTCDCLFTNSTTIWIARGGRAINYLIPNVIKVVDVKMHGKFGSSSNSFFWLLPDGLYRSNSSTELGTLYAPGATAFAVSGSRVCWIKDQKLFDVEYPNSASDAVARNCPGAENLRFSGQKLIVEKGGSSWTVGSKGFIKYCDGTGACEYDGHIYSSRFGVIYRDLAPIALGDEAVECDGIIYIRLGSEFYNI